MIDPDATVVITPAVAFGARGAALLALQSHAATSVGCARVPLFIIRITRDGLSLTVAIVSVSAVSVIAVLILTALIVAILLAAIAAAVAVIGVIGVVVTAPAATYREVGAASMIDPNALVIVAPAVAFGAWGTALLAL